MDAMVSIPKAENTAWGFYGTMGERAEEAWPIAAKAIAAATGSEPDHVRAFLDSRHGRHFANDVACEMATGSVLEDAICTTARRWMESRIDLRTSRDYDIPRGLPRLVGLVISYGVGAESE